MRSVHTGLVLGLALSLLPPATAFAQAPAASVPLVQLQVSFVAASAVDVDDLDMKFDRVPFPMPALKPPPGGTYLQVLSGGLVPQFYQTLVRTRGKVAQASTLITIDNVPYTFRADMPVPYESPVFTASPFGETDAERAQHTRLLPTRTGLTITPRVNSDGSITLNLAPELGNVAPAELGIHAGILRTVPSGEVLVLAGLPINSERQADDPELLIFVTPTIFGAEAQKADAGLPAPPAPPAQGTPDATKTLTLETSDVGLQAIAAVLGRQAGVKVSVLGAAGSYKPVSVRLAAVPLVEALRAIAASAGARMSRNAAGVYVFSPGAGRRDTGPKGPVY